MVCKIVVIATGGFSRNPNIVEDWIPEIQEFNWHMEAWFGMVGDSNEWMEHLEVNIQTNSNIGLYAHSTPDPLLGHPEVMIVTALERSVIVNTNGQRVFDETKTQSLESGQIMLDQGPLFAIFDSNSWQGTQIQGPGYNYEPPLILTGPGIHNILTFLSLTTSNSWLMKLALQDLFYRRPLRHTTNLSRREMTSSVKIYSIFTPLQTPPFYALPIVLSTGKSFAGAETSSNHQALENVYISW